MESTTKPTLGFAMCGSFCTHRDALAVLRELSVKYRVVPILSYAAAETDTRFGTAALLAETLTGICGRPPVMTITEAEKFGPSAPLDELLLCPCTGNTLAKIAHGITDTPVAMAVKAHLRCDRPLLIALASNDAMAGNFVNIGTLLNRKKIYFVPMRQDDPAAKPHSLVADFSKIPECLEKMRRGEQMRPLFL
ncbi:MAG: dipicolinate synthase subunit B [Eubacteriales bacterium]